MPLKSGFGNSQDLVKIEDIKEGTLILKDGSLRQIVMVSGVNFALLSEQDQNLVLSSYTNFLNTIAFPLQVVIHSRKINIQKYLDTLEERKKNELSPLLQNQIGEYAGFIKQFVADNPIMEKSFYVVVPWYPASIQSTGSSIMNFFPFGKKKSEAPEKDKKTEETEEARLEMLKQNLPQLRQRVNEVVEGLIAMDLETIVLGDELLVELFYNFYNPESVERENMNIVRP